MRPKRSTHGVLEVSITISTDLVQAEEDLNLFDERLGPMLDEALRRGAHYLAEVMKELTPKRTGETAESIGVTEAYLDYDVGSDSPVFGWLDQGTSGHGPIVPRNAQALHWEDEGGEVFAKYVLFVSGIEPHHIIDGAMELAEPGIQADIELALDQAWIESQTARGEQEYGD